MPLTLPSVTMNSVGKSRGRGTLHIHDRNWDENEELALIRCFDYETKATKSSTLSRQSWIKIEEKMKVKFPDKFITCDECEHHITKLGEQKIQDVMKTISKPRAETAFERARRELKEEEFKENQEFEVQFEGTHKVKRKRRNVLSASQLYAALEEENLLEDRQKALIAAVSKPVSEKDNNSSWNPPSIYRALRYQKSLIFRQGTASLSQDSVMRDEELGVGLNLYFQFVYSMTVGLIFMTVLSAPCLLFSYFGSGMGAAAADGDDWGIYHFTVGNIGYNKYDSDYDKSSECSSDSYSVHTKEGGCWHVLGLEFSVTQAEQLITLFELLQIGVFFSTIYYLRYKFDCRLLQHRLPGDVSIANYSVMVTDLPEDCFEEELIDHFSQLYDLSTVDWQGRLPVFSAKPVSKVNKHNDGDRIYLDKWVAECSMHTKIGSLLRGFRKQQRLQAIVERNMAKVRMFREEDTVHQGGKLKVRREQAEKQLSIAKEKLKILFDENLSDLTVPDEVLPKQAGDRSRMNESLLAIEKIMKTMTSPKIMAAFVSFEYNESFVRCVEDYERYSSTLRWFYPTQLKLSAEDRMTVRPAPEPDQIYWTRLERSPLKSIVFRIWTTSLIIGIIIGSITIMAMMYEGTPMEVEKFVPFVAVVPLVFNWVSNFAIEKLLEILGYHITVDDHGHSLMRYLLLNNIIQLVIFSIAVNLLVNRGNAPAILKDLHIADGEFDDFSRPWYGTFGQVFVIILGVKGFVPPVFELCHHRLWLALKRCYYHRQVRNLVSTSIVTQGDLNALHVGPKFNLATSIVKVLTVVFVMMSFAPGIPILTPMALASLILIFCVDKFLLYRSYVKPPMYTEAMMKTALRVLPLAGLTRLLIGCWMYSRSDIFPDYPTKDDWQEIVQYIYRNLRDVSFFGSYAAATALSRIVRENVMPLFILFVLILLAALIRIVAEKRVFGAVYATIIKCCRGIIRACLGHRGAADLDVYPEKELYLTPFELHHQQALAVLGRSKRSNIGGEVRCEKLKNCNFQFSSLRTESAPLSGNYYRFCGIEATQHLSSALHRHRNPMKKKKKKRKKEKPKSGLSALTKGDKEGETGEEEEEEEEEILSLQGVSCCTCFCRAMRCVICCGQMALPGEDEVAIHRNTDAPLGGAASLSRRQYSSGWCAVPPKHGLNRNRHLRDNSALVDDDDDDIEIGSSRHHPHHLLGNPSASASGGELSLTQSSSIGLGIGSETVGSSSVRSWGGGSSSPKHERGSPPRSPKNSNKRLSHEEKHWRFMKLKQRFPVLEINRGDLASIDAPADDVANSAPHHMLNEHAYNSATASVSSAGPAGVGNIVKERSILSKVYDPQTGLVIPRGEEGKDDALDDLEHKEQEEEKDSGDVVMMMMMPKPILQSTENRQKSVRRSTERLGFQSTGRLSGVGGQGGEDTDTTDPYLKTYEVIGERRCNSYKLYKQKEYQSIMELVYDSVSQRYHDLLISRGETEMFTHKMHIFEQRTEALLAEFKHEVTELQAVFLSKRSNLFANTSTGIEVKLEKFIEVTKKMQKDIKKDLSDFNAQLRKLKRKYEVVAAETNSVLQKTMRLSTSLINLKSDFETYCELMFAKLDKFNEDWLQLRQECEESCDTYEKEVEGFLSTCNIESMAHHSKMVSALPHMPVPTPMSAVVAQASTGRLTEGSPAAISAATAEAVSSASFQKAANEDNMRRTKLAEAQFELIGQFEDTELQSIRDPDRWVNEHRVTLRKYDADFAAMIRKFKSRVQEESKVLHEKFETLRVNVEGAVKVAVDAQPTIMKGKQPSSTAAVVSAARKEGGVANTTKDLIFH